AVLDRAEREFTGGCGCQEAAGNCGFACASGGAAMRKLFELALGIVTSMGGFLEVGSIATAAQAGAGYGYQLLWPILLGALCLVFLMEMAGRMAAVSDHPLPAAVRERVGFNYFVIPLTAQTIVDYLVLTSEIGGMSLG